MLNRHVQCGCWASTEGIYTPSYWENCSSREGWSCSLREGKGCSSKGETVCWGRPFVEKGDHSPFFDGREVGCLLREVVCWKGKLLHFVEGGREGAVRWGRRPFTICRRREWAVCWEGRLFATCWGREGELFVEGGGHSLFIEGGRGAFIKGGGHSPFVEGGRELFVKRGGCSPLVEGGRGGCSSREKTIDHLSREGGGRSLRDKAIHHFSREGEGLFVERGGHLSREEAACWEKGLLVEGVRRPFVKVGMRQTGWGRRPFVYLRVGRCGEKEGRTLNFCIGKFKIQHHHMMLEFQWTWTNCGSLYSKFLTKS